MAPRGQAKAKHLARSSQLLVSLSIASLSRRQLSFTINSSANMEKTEWAALVDRCKAQLKQNGNDVRP